jgi:two-component system sensor histidine kinase BaeS
VSFRLKLFGLVLLVAISAIGATAWLSLKLTARQIEHTQDEATKHVVDTVETIRAYGRRHGTWAGVSHKVQQLSEANHQRIRLVNLYGQVTVDSDHLAKRKARPVVSPPTLIDPQARFALGPSYEKAALKADGLVLGELQQYRETAVYARCLTERNIEPPAVTPDEHGVPIAGPGTDADCRATARLEQQYAAEGDEATVHACRSAAVAADCMVKAFGDRADGFAPEPLQLFLGAVDDDPLDVLARPGLLSIGGIGLLALIGTAAIARHAGRPLRSLTAASRRLADGHLDARVPVGGRDEFGQLSTSFNRMAEALQESEQAQRRLVAGVAHELRTPLSNLQGYLEALQDGVVPPSRELFASLHDEVLLQRRILDDLQDLALAEAGHLTYRRTGFDLAELAEAGRVAHLAVAEARGVRLTAETVGPLPVDADQDRLRQVLGNLVGNALRHTEPGGEVILRAFPSGRLAVLEVVDTGSGIAAHDLPHVFQRFWRADPARDRETGGSGLGLTIALQIVRDHGGDISVTSLPGVGSTFRVSLPSATAAAGT